MLSEGVGRDGQQQDRPRPDAGGGLWGMQDGQQGQGMAWTGWEEPQWLARSDLKG